MMKRSLCLLVLAFPFAFALMLVGAIPTALAAPAESPVITPREPIHLFNGRDLTNFYTWEMVHGHDDPDRVFTVVEQVDGAPAIRISGQHDGGLTTRERYANYRLVAEFRWGLAKWSPRLTRARNSGILFHCQGEDGNRDLNFRAPILRSVEAQIMEGRTGEILPIPGYERGRPERTSPKVKVNVVKQGKKIYWRPDGTPTEVNAGPIGWLDEDPDWQDVHGFRGRADVEKPAGEWNRFEIVCSGGDIVFFLNGVKVNEAKDCTYREGRILFQSESTEIFFRRIELFPLGGDSPAAAPR